MAGQTTEPPKLKPTRDQRRAQAAFEAIDRMRNQPHAEDYGRQCLRLPILLQQEGLCLTLAFFEAKKAKKDYFGLLFNDLLKILDVNSAQVRSADAVTYQRLTREALRTAVWFKRYAEAVLGVSLESAKGDD